MMTSAHCNFFDPELLDTEYFRRQRDAYETYFDQGLVSRYRCYPVIVEKLQSIFEYNKNHAAHFARRIKNQPQDMRSCEAVVSEVIVYAHYTPLAKDGIVRSLRLCRDDYDLRIERKSSQPDVFLEVFCIMPEFTANERGVYDIKTHTQTAFSSVRQKLLQKVRKQKQMQKVRENWAVIELNNISIAGEFTVLSSLSDGYKLTLDPGTMKVVQSGYDWTRSVFDAPETQNLHGIIHFDLGDYEHRRYILNDRVRGDAPEERPLVP